MLTAVELTPKTKDSTKSGEFGKCFTSKRNLQMNEMEKEKGFPLHMGWNMVVMGMSGRKCDLSFVLLIAIHNQRQKKILPPFKKN